MVAVVVVVSSKRAPPMGKRWRKNGFTEELATARVFKWLAGLPLDSIFALSVRTPTANWLAGSSEAVKRSALEAYLRTPSG